MLQQQENFQIHPLSAPFPPSNEIVPKHFTDCKIFIPTKGRAFNKNATWTTLLGGGGTDEFDQSKAIPFTLVVEPQEEETYKTVFSRVIELNLATIEVLPENNRGVSFARNYILTHLAPRPEECLKNGKTSWFWIMDDDIAQFLVTIGAGRLAPLRANDCIGEVYRRVAQILAHEKSEALPVPVGMFALEYSQFALHSAPRHIMCNSYCNIAVMMNLSRMPEGIRYRFRVREDYDFALQLIRSGRTNFRFHDLGFRVPSMSSQTGGMTAYYASEKNKDIRLQNKLFLECWGGPASCGENHSTPFANEVMKGGSTATTSTTKKNQRYDVKVHWSRLNDILKAIEFLKTLPGKCSSYEDGLVAPFGGGSNNNTVAPGTKNNSVSNNNKENENNDDDDDDKNGKKCHQEDPIENVPTSDDDDDESESGEEDENDSKSLLIPQRRDRN